MRQVDTLRLVFARRSVRLLCAVPLVALLTAGVASAYWSASSLPGGSGAAAASTVNAGSAPTVAVNTSNVTVTWPTDRLTNGAIVSGYIVKRYDATTGAAQTILSACNGTIAGITCTESNVPAGSWRYTVTPVIGSWIGAESAKSSIVTMDSSAPVNSLSLSVLSGHASLSGTTVYYRGVAAGSFQIVNALTDSGSGPASSATSTLGGTSTGWSHTASTVSTPAGGPFTSNTFSWTAGTTSSPTETVTGKDAAGNATTTTVTFVNNSNAPTGGSVAASGLVGTGSAYSTATTLSLVLNTGTDASGIASGAQLLRATAPLTSTGGADGVCGTFGSYSLIATDPNSPLSDAVADQACYRYEYVVTDTVGNSTTYTSSSIKVDTTAPSAPTFTFTSGTNTYWSGTGSTVYYRSSASSGSFAVNASSTDAAAGITGYTFPSLGTNWTENSGATGVATYSWSGTPSTPGTKSVTATNNAGLTSTSGSFVSTADTTAPTTGTLTYPSGTQYSTTVNVTFTTGTDSGSGIGTRLLERASATLTGSTCGTFGSFATITGGTNPSSPFTDTVASGKCYKYEYVTSDNVGNQGTAAVNSNTVKVAPGYYQTISGTSGLVDYWRLGESAIVKDTFTGTNSVGLALHAGEIGAGWTENSTISNATVTAESGRIHKSGSSSFSEYYASGVPASANYTVGADVHVSSNLSGDEIGVLGRIDTTAASGTFYAAVYEQSTSEWVIYRIVNGASAAIARSTSETLVTGSTYRLSLDMNGTSLKLYVNGTLRASATDAYITSAGRAGVIFGNGANTTFDSATAGYQLDNFEVSPQLADSQGTATGSFIGGVTLGATGAFASDTNTAATFDGVNDYAQTTDSVSGDFSIEFWFKSTQGLGTAQNWDGDAGLVDANVSGLAKDFGVSLRSDGVIATGVGSGYHDTSVDSTASGLNNGAWHYVCVTRSMSSGLLSLYVDGALSGSVTGTTVALSSPTLTIGRLNSGGNYFAGSLDEVAIYNTVLTSSTVASHYSVGHAS
jgi:hypothetical protein